MYSCFILDWEIPIIIIQFHILFDLMDETFSKIVIWNSIFGFLKLHLFIAFHMKKQTEWTKSAMSIDDFTSRHLLLFE